VQSGSLGVGLGVCVEIEKDLFDNRIKDGKELCVY